MSGDPHVDSNDEPREATAGERQLEKTAKIYRAAARIFHEKGYHATSINEIADAVHLTKAGLYYYIRGKQDLLVGIMNYAMDLLEQQVIEPAIAYEDALDRLRSVVSAHARFIVDEQRELNILVNELEGLSDENRSAIKSRQRDYIDFIRRTLDELRQQGKLAAVDSTVGAFGLLGMILWVSRWYRPDGRLSADQVVEEITNMALAAILPSNVASATA